MYIKDAANNYVPELVGPLSGKMDYDSYGAFANVKIGKKFVFFNFSLAAYYQDYGRYQLLGGGTTRFKGVSIVPSYGMQFNLNTNKKKKNKKAVGTQV